MAFNNPKYFFLMTAFCTFLLFLPITVQAASDDELSEVRAQLLALSERLDRLEAENQSLKSANAELTKSSQQTTKAVAMAEVSKRTEAVAADVEQQADQTSWTERMRWQGDFRYRYEAFNIEGEPNRDRNRIRARAALIADVTPTIEVGLGLASGGEDPVSSNQTLGGGGSTKGLNIDLAYFDWSGLTGTHIVGGKFKNYLVDSGSNALLWDSDWRPEGIGASWANDIFFVNGLGTWVESDSKAGQSFAYATQAGINMEVGNDVQLVAGVGYYVFDTKGLESFFGDDDDFFGNSFDPVSKTYLYDYEELEVFAGLVFDLWGRPLLTFGTYVQNQAVDENDTGWIVGFKYGAAKNKGEWQFGYAYERLEADAVLGLLTDSDFGGGGTNAKGSIIKGSYAIHKNFNANFTYFINKVGIRFDDPIDFKRLQLDLSFKY
jgi:hypothetical protein